MFNSFRAPRVKKQKLLALKYLRVLMEYLRISPSLAAPH